LRAAGPASGRGQGAGDAGHPSHAEGAVRSAGSGEAEVERILLTRIEEALAVLSGFDAADRRLVRAALWTITSGQELDVRRFAAASAERVVALQTEADLDDYTYRVAGCVGEFWTRICRAHLFPAARVDDGLLLLNGVRFGRGLQLVNILRDLPRDLRQGRCYLPETRLTVHGLTPGALLDRAAMPRFRPLFEDHLDLAQACLADGWSYTNALPIGQVRVRLACAWPILIGARTVVHLRRGNVLDSAHRIKVSRAEVRQLLVRSLLCYPWSGAWNRLFERAADAG
jgi:farnesyl-diphosphate farnesyltransferase